MAIKKLIFVSAVSMAISTFASMSVADHHGGKVEDYVVNPYGHVWKNSFGECWRDRFAATDDRKEECGYSAPAAPEPEPVAAPAPIPEPEPTPAPVVMTCPDLITVSDVHFGFNSAILDDQDKANLTDEVATLRNMNKGNCERVKGAVIIGHTDNVGSDSFNQQLSERRAEAVKNFLQSEGVSIELTSEGKGESDPIADNSSEEGRAKNRRVVIKLIQK